MADPATMAAGVGMGATALGGVFGAMGAQTTAKGQQLGIQGQILNTVGQIFGLQTKARQYGYEADISDYQAGVSRANKQIAEGNRNYALEVGETTAQAAGMQTRSAAGQMRTHQAASGIDLSSGSFANVRESITDIGQYNEALIRANAAKQAYGYAVEAMTDESQAELYDYTATTQRAQAADTVSAMGLAEQAIPLQEKAFQLAGTAGDISSISSLLGAGASVASKWSKLSTVT